jgi:hypothetical protein
MAICAAALLANGITQIIHSQRGSGDRVVGIAGHVALSTMTVSLLCLPVLFLTLREYGTGAAARRGAILASAGAFALAAVCTSSLINGKDLSAFAVLGPLTNAAWLAGAVALAVGLRRAGRLPAVVIYGLPVLQLAIVIAATFGGGLLAAAYVVASARALVTNPTSPAAQPALVQPSS